MHYQQYLQRIRQSWRIITIITLATIVVSLITSSLQKPLYRASGRILITQKTNANLDMYKASQSAERLAMLFAKIIKSSSFMKDILNSGFPIDPIYFPKKEKDLREKWAKMVSSRVSTDTSIIEINVYHPEASEAKNIMNAIIYNFSKKGKAYYNLGDEVGIVVLDTPLVSERPVKPNILLNIILSLFIGFAISAIVILWKTQNLPQKPTPITPPEPKKEENEKTEIMEVVQNGDTIEEKKTDQYIGGLKIVEK